MVAVLVSKARGTTAANSSTLVALYSYPLSLATYTLSQGQQELVVVAILHSAK